MRIASGQKMQKPKRTQYEEGDASACDHNPSEYARYYHQALDQCVHFAKSHKFVGSQSNDLRRDDPTVLLRPGLPREDIDTSGL